MAMLVVITERTGAEHPGAGDNGAESPGVASFDAEAAHRLADIGVTSVAVAADATTEAVVLEGWAFDVHAHGDEAASILVGNRRCRALQPVLQTLLVPQTGPLPQKGESA